MMDALERKFQSLSRPSSPQTGVTSYDQLDVRFKLAFERVQRAHPELLNELSQRLPLVPSDEALEALAILQKFPFYFPLFPI